MLFNCINGDRRAAQRERPAQFVARAGCNPAGEREDRQKRERDADKTFLFAGDGRVDEPLVAGPCEQYQRRPQPADPMLSHLFASMLLNVPVQTAQRAENGEIVFVVGAKIQAVFF